MLGQGGFPGAVVPQHGYKVPLLHREADVMEHRHRLRVLHALIVGKGYVLKLNQIFHKTASAQADILSLGIAGQACSIGS